MPSLNGMLQQVQRFVDDAKMEKFDPGDLLSYINESRREVAMRAQAIRVLPLIQGSIVSITVVSPGAGYSSPTINISPPDSPSGFGEFPNGAQATATAQIVNGEIIGVNVTYGGDGYFQPVVIAEDATGADANFIVNTTVQNQLVQGQEVYPFSAVDLSPFPGVESVYMVRGVSIIYANYRYSIPMYSFSVYQSMIRQYVAQTYQYVPTFGSQFGRGTSGSLYMYPPPSETYQLEWDCQCLPQDLLDNNSVEAIPEPWTDAVPYFAAHLAHLGRGNFNASKYFYDLYDQRMMRFGAYAEPGRRTNVYGRW